MHSNISKGESFPLEFNLQGVTKTIEVEISLENKNNKHLKLQAFRIVTTPIYCNFLQKCYYQRIYD